MNKLQELVRVPVFVDFLCGFGVDYYQERTNHTTIEKETHMPNGHGHKEYGGHRYTDHGGTSDCKYGCGCWMGPARSGGPTGLDPGGTCPNNPKDGNLLGGNNDYDHVVTERIDNLSARLYQAETRLKQVEPGTDKLADELATAKAELAKKHQLLEELRRLLNTSA